MKITEHIQKANGTLVSFEVLPPLKGKTIATLYDHLDPLMEFKPSWINVTYHRSETMFKKKADGTFEKVEVRKRPGTVGICAAIMNHYQVDAVPHIICGGFTKRETEDALIDLDFLGIDNVLVLRGDAAKNEAAFEPEKDGNHYAIDLLKQVSLESFTVLDPTSNARVYWDVKDGDRKVISKLHLLETLRANSVKIPGKLMKDHVNQMINHEGSLVTPAYVDDPTPGVESPHIIDSILAASSHARVHVFFTSSSSEEVISRVPDSMKTCYMDNTHWFLLEDVRHQLAEDVSKFILQI